MFETSVIRAQATAARGKVSLLTVSIAAHSAVVLGALVLSVATVSFPKNAPDEFAMAPLFASVQIPPPLGTPDGGKKAAAVPEQKKETPPPPPNVVTAPPAVPEEIIPAETPSTGTETSDGTDAGGTQPGKRGVPWGDPDSPGDLDAPPVVTPGPAAVENKVYTVGEVKPPVIVTRVDPNYPPALMRAKLAGKVAVRCIIDKNGRIRDAQVVYATMPAFGDAVLQALPRWRYQPASLQGQAVDCWLDLTVDFGVR